MTAVRIRPARPDDAAAILDMIRELARFEHAEDQVRASEADLVQFGWGPAPRFEALLAELANGGDGEGAGAADPVGFALYFHTYSTWTGRPGLFVEDLYVLERARRLGVGRRLMAACAAIAVERDCRRMDLNVLHWNPARDFYESLGLAHMEEWLPYRVAGPALARLAAQAGSTGVGMMTLSPTSES
jgi:GNAT superfamily N-acetyltransferase